MHAFQAFAYCGLDRITQDCWAGMESAVDPKDKTGSHEGLFQLDSTAWSESKIGISFSKNAYDPASNATAATKYLSSLESQEMKEAGSAGNPAAYLAQALTDYRWGKASKRKNGVHASDIENCAKALDNGDCNGAMRAIRKH